MIFVEGRLQFEFSENWQVVKLDDEPDYRSRIGKLEGTKAVDFVGVFNKEKLYFIEVKDFREHRIENRGRLQNGELAIEIGQKVRDSLACLMGAYRTSSSSDNWQQFVKSLQDKRKDIIIVAWLEYDLPDDQNQQRKVLTSIRTSAFKTKVDWLTPRVVVASVKSSIVPDLQVQYLKKTV